MRQEYTLFQMSETVFRLTSRKDPGELFNVSLSGICSCGEHLCKHHKMVENHLNPPGITIETARVYARRVIAAFSEDPMINSVRATGVEKNGTKVTKINFLVQTRGKGVPTDIEGRYKGVNLRMLFRFQKETKPNSIALSILLEERPDEWIKLRV